MWEGNPEAAMEPLRKSCEPEDEAGESVEIAKQRGTSTKTVANQLYAIYRKLGISARHELALVL